MNKPHKYVKEIIHWANGGQIQWGFELADGDGECNEWHDYRIWDKCTDFNNPQVIFRIKPKTAKYRVALMLKHDSPVDVHTLRMVTTDEQEMFIKQSKSYGVFVEWITEWIEVEI